VRSFALIVVTAGALIIGIAAPASADPPSNPGCYGEFVSTGAQMMGGVGGFVSGVATSPAFKGSGNMTIGQDGVPTFKVLACGP
jgi:hypothetical protein